MTGRNQFTAGLAAALMLIDHIGAMFFPEQMGFRMIGRLSFPLFAYGIAQGVAYTSCYPKYLLRILLAAVISQPIYIVAFHQTNLNPLFTLAYGSVVVWLWRRGEKERIIAFLFMLLSYWLKSSYGWYGVLTIFFFAFYEAAKNLCFYGQVLLQIAYGYATGVWLQSLSLGAFSLVGKSWGKSVYLPKYFFYVFYPLHLCILVWIRASIS